MVNLEEIEIEETKEVFTNEFDEAVCFLWNQRDRVEDILK